MPDPNLIFDPTDGWNNTTTFPTSPTSQAQTRTLFQRLFTQIQTFINSTYTVWINATFATKTDLAGAVLSGVADDSLTNAKMATDVKIGSLAAATTTVKTDVIAAMNELVTRLAVAEASITSMTSELDADIGIVKYMASATVPARHLEAKGQAVLAATYPKLTTAIYCGDANNATAEFGYKCTNPSSPTSTRSTSGTYIVLPEGRGVVARGWDNGKGYDTGRTFGSYQADGNKSHSHTNSVGTESATHTHGLNYYTSGTLGGTDGWASGHGNIPPTYTATTAVESATHNHTVTINADGNAETTVKNLCLLAVIKY